MRHLILVALTTLTSLFAKPVQAETVKYICNYQGFSIPEENSGAKHNIALTFDLDAKTVSGWPQYWNSTASIQVEITEGSMVIKELSTTDLMMRFIISRTDGTVSGGNRALYIKGLCKKVAES